MLHHVFLPVWGHILTYYMRIIPIKFGTSCSEIRGIFLVSCQTFSLIMQVFHKCHSMENLLIRSLCIFDYFAQWNRKVLTQSEMYCVHLQLSLHSVRLFCMDNAEQKKRLKCTWDWYCRSNNSVFNLEDCFPYFYYWSMLEIR